MSWIQIGGFIELGALEISTGQIDADAPTWIVERLDAYAGLVLPIAVALPEVPSLKVFEMVHLVLPNALVQQRAILL